MFELSEKLKFSIKVSLSIVLAFLIPFSQGWEQAQVAAITILLIATMGSLNQSVLKGAMRVLGTVIGAIIGLSLIALFPQDRLLYLLFLSIFVSIFLYLVRASKGDPSFFMLSAMTMMMVFDNGNVDDVFLFALDKVYMSILGISIYTLVGLFIWPYSVEDDTQENAKKLLLLQLDIFSKRKQHNSIDVNELTTLIEHEEILYKSSLDTSSSSLTHKQWQSMQQNYTTLNALLQVEIYHHEKYAHHTKEITILFESILHALNTKEEILAPKKININYEDYNLKELTHLQRASLLSELHNLESLHFELSELARKLNALHSPIPTLFSIDNIRPEHAFIWGDIEHLKGTLISFIIFWTATIIWIVFNPPAGFMIVTLATGLSVLTTFTPAKPSILITVFTFSFVFALLSYVFILPNLHYAWELAVFIFIYSFISFYFLPEKLIVFFMIGLFTLNITNEMHYNFDVFLLILLIFYIFLLLLQFFSYIPFSMKPEYLFLKTKNRLFYFAEVLFQRSYNLMNSKNSFINLLSSYYASAHIFSTSKAMQFWAAKIDSTYFNTIDKDMLDNFVKESEKFAYLSSLLYQQSKKMKDNQLILHLRKNDMLPYKSSIDLTLTEASVNDNLKVLLSSIDFTIYKEESIIIFYENISLRKNVWTSYFQCKELMKQLNFKSLQVSRF